MTLSDDELVSARDEVDRAVALAEAYRQHGSHVYGIAREICGDLRAESLTQETFLDLWNERDADVHVSSLRSYLSTRVHRRAVELLRSDVDDA
jgi:DNA-directed RNA polymerase specialized sigma24 family protein